MEDDYKHRPFELELVRYHDVVMFRITHQDDIFNRGSFARDMSNGWKVRSVVNPAINLDVYTIWIQGNDKNKDNDIAVVNCYEVSRDHDIHPNEIADHLIGDIKFIVNELNEWARECMERTAARVVMPSGASYDIRLSGNEVQVETNVPTGTSFTELNNLIESGRITSDAEDFNFGRLISDEMDDEEFCR